MVDIVDKSRRSEMMSVIRSTNTRPEMIVRSMLHRMGYRFRVHKKIEGCKPDIVLRKHRTVIFVHGCFWHRHPGCKNTYNPKTRIEFWQDKFQQNVMRDRRNMETLRKAGWRVIIIWECETKKFTDVVAKLENSFENCVH